MRSPQWHYDQLDLLRLETEVQSLNLKVDRLESFFKAVARLTLSHAVIGDRAVVYAAELGAELEKVDPEWWRDK